MRRRVKVAGRGAEPAPYSDQRECRGTQTKDKPEDQKREERHSPSCCSPLRGRMLRGLLSHPAFGTSLVPSQEPATRTSSMLPAAHCARLPSLPRPAPKSLYGHREPVRPSYPSSSPARFPTHLPDFLPACILKDQ